MQERNVTITKPKEKTYLINDENKIISVCAYCRVSTDKNDQKNSFDAQKRFFTMEFERHSNWIKKKIFADEGISGTSLKKRDEFNRMIAAACAGEYDLIITKEVSRFSRNVQDILNIVMELCSKGVYIWFLSDDINTEDEHYREKLLQLGNQAEMESRKTSRRVKWGQRLQMERGVVFGRKEMYGYNICRDENGKQFFEIIEDEAKVVRRVFEMYANGKGTFQISKILENEGIKTKRYKNGWSNTVILRILRNEKYVGDLETGKTYTPDCLTHQKKYNRGESEKIYIKNHHPEAAIVDRKLWDKVQYLLMENSPDDEVKKKHSNRYWCSGKLFCGECGERFISNIRKQKSGNIIKTWKCWNNHKYGTEKNMSIDTKEIKKVGCNCKGVNDKVFKQGMYDIITQIIIPNFDRIYERMKSEIDKSSKYNVHNYECQIEELQEEIQKAEVQLAELTQKLLKKEISDISYKVTEKSIIHEIESFNDEIAQLEDKLNESNVFDPNNEKRLEELKLILNLKNDEINEDVFRNLIDKIEVYNDHILKFYFYALDNPIEMQYFTSGKKENYKVNFKVLSL